MKNELLTMARIKEDAKDYIAKTLRRNQIRPLTFAKSGDEVMKLAKKRAEKVGNLTIQTSDIVLALIEYQPLRGILSKIGLEPDKLHSTIESQVNGVYGQISRNPQLDPSAEMAIRNGRLFFNQENMRAEDIFMALAICENPIGGILRSAGILREKNSSYFAPATR